MNPTRGCSLWVFLILLASPLAVRADAIDGPPACPPGTTGRSSHHGQWCVPDLCDASTSCDAGERCMPWRVCTRGSMVPASHREYDPSAVPTRMELVIATCEPASACMGTEEPPPPTIGVLVDEANACTTVEVCVPSVLPPLPAVPAAVPVAAPTSTPSPSPPAEASSDASACGCAAAGAGRGGSMSIGILALALVALRRRRRS